MKEVTGLTGAAPVWHDVMMTFLKDKPVEAFVRPEGLVERGVDSVSGLLPTKNSATIKELFIPHRADLLRQYPPSVLAQQRDGQLATVFTPPEQVEEKVFEIYPPEAANGSPRQMFRSRPPSTTRSMARRPPQAMWRSPAESL